MGRCSVKIQTKKGMRRCKKNMSVSGLCYTHRHLQPLKKKTLYPKCCVPVQGNACKICKKNRVFFVCDRCDRDYCMDCEGKPLQYCIECIKK